ncbi:NADPH oxidase 5-like isoform X3 [Limulus polyphemus]|uniref:NADPH oxidase 5-like isoform X3 n=1 Tax=Limulus polyphemus TaxID=6850 RepID=A0ABM1RWL4_LIMPO|nr:NADPH oxidase 5-like isoform X3 [Limulus polyphemus]
MVCPQYLKKITVMISQKAMKSVMKSFHWKIIIMIANYKIIHIVKFHCMEGEINKHHLQVQTQSNAFPFLESDTHNNVSQSQTHCVTFPLSESDTHEIGSHDETHCSAFYLPESNTNDNGSKKQRYNYETLLLEGTNVQGSQNQKQSVSIRLPKDDVSKSQVKNNESPICKDDDNNSKHKSCSQTEHDAQIVNESGNNYTTVSDKSAEHFDIPDTVFLSIPEENKKRKMMRTISAPAPHKSISPRLIREGTNTCRPQMNERSLSAPAVPQGFKRTLPTILLPVLQENKDEEEISGLVPPLSYETLQLEDVFKMSKPLKLTVEGPYGSPTRQIFRSQHAVLIATGIGVTPFASILQSIMMRYRHARMKCPKCNHQWVNQVPHSIHNLRKVDFIWINRDQRSFEWFVNLLSELEIQQAEDGDIMERFLDIHMFITSALRKNDIKALGLQMALDLLHEKSKRCLITGLKTRTQPGRPDWNKKPDYSFDDKNKS